MDSVNENSNRITVKFEHTLAQNYLNMMTVHHDLTFVVDCCARLNNLYSVSPADKIVIKGIWFAQLLSMLVVSVRGQEMV